MTHIISKDDLKIKDTDTDSILRCVRAKDCEELLPLIRECVDESRSCLDYRVCYAIFPLEVRDNECKIGDFSVFSRDLAKHLNGCKEALIFAATLGSRFDRLISRYSLTAPSKALMLQGVGTERIESLCDAFCALAKSRHSTATGRFSAGYGDMSLECQKDIFRALMCEKNIGLTLNKSLMMSPSKSVTAVIGIK